MSFRPASLAFTLLLVLFFPVLSGAQDTSDSTLHVLRPIIHTEQDKAELCLEFDHPLDQGKQGRIVGNIRLESDGKPVVVETKNLSVNANQFCLSTLDHRRGYRLILAGLRGTNGEKLSTPYRFSFYVPGRQPSLAFANGAFHNGVIRWNESSPVLRTLNVDHVHVELYRLTDPGLMAEAWEQRAQTDLAPSESAYFARHNGQLMWQGDLIYDAVPDKIVERKLTLRDVERDELTMKLSWPHGLYLVTASASDAIVKSNDIKLAPLAAAWLMLSDLELKVVQGTDGYYALTDAVTMTAALKDVHCLIEDRSQKKIAEGMSDSDGVIFLPLAESKKSDAFLLMGTTNTGDVDFIDLPPKDARIYTLPNLEATLNVDKPFYPLQATANVTLRADDLQGQAAMPKDSQLQISRPDHSAYTSIPVPPVQGDSVSISLPVPIGSGLWPIKWQQNDGHILAETMLRSSSNQQTPHLEITADKPMLSGDGDVNLVVRSLSYTGDPSPYVTGQILVAWTVPDHLFLGWDDYHFGGGDAKEAMASPIASFLTDDKGFVQAHRRLIPPDDGTAIHEAVITIKTDPAFGAVDPPPLIFPVGPKDYTVGIKPSVADGKFAEDSLARFDVVVLDTEGKSINNDNLTYQIYEEGRSFDWYQADGRWDYKPLQQQRRIGGGDLDVKAEGPNIIEWPVTAGMYRLDVTDDAGTIRARLPFSAGGGVSKSSVLKRSTLVLTPDSQVLSIGKLATINFKLNQAAMVSAVIADDHIRKVIHQYKSAGESSISFVPEKGWGKNISVSIEACSSVDVDISLIGQTILALQSSADESSGVSAVLHPPTGPSQDSHQPLVISGSLPQHVKKGAMIQFTLNVQNNAATEGTYHYTVSALGGLKIVGRVRDTFTLGLNQRKDLSFSLDADQGGSKEIRLDLIGPRNVHVGRVWPLLVESDTDVFSDIASVSLAPKQSWTSIVRDKSHDKAQTDFVFVAPQPLFDTPYILSRLLLTHAFTTGELAATLEALRLWQDGIVHANMSSLAQLEALKNQLLIRLILRQNSDGSFSPMPAADASMESTSVAVIALSHIDQPFVKPVIDEATNWLRHKLENSWFDEHQRSSRAIAYAALAAADRLDVASLHYFADTSVDKSLPTLAAAELAFAFAKINDRDKTQFWLEMAHPKKNPSPIPLALMPWLAENVFFDAHELISALEGRFQRTCERIFR
jgi:uncharacterized protein YfaS (alpha-2-macroglobulin family)